MDRRRPNPAPSPASNGMTPAQERRMMLSAFDRASGTTRAYLVRVAMALVANEPTAPASPA